MSDNIGVAAPMPMLSDDFSVAFSSQSRVAYILLGLFLGGFGVHDFYAGYKCRGLIKLLALLVCCCTGGIVMTASSIWALVDVCTIRVDVDGKPFA